MARLALWDAIEADRRRWIRVTATVLLMAVSLVALGFLYAISHSGQVVGLGVRLLIPIMAVFAYPILKNLRSQGVPSMIGAVPAPTGSSPDTTKSLYDVSLASGLQLPRLWLYTADDLNAFIWKDRRHINVAVSTGFAKLPKSEQRAGLAMLAGRSRIDITAFAAEHEIAAAGRENPVPANEDVALFSAWLDAAIAGDREGLAILKEPAPLICLLERLSVESTVVPGLPTRHGVADAAFGFLAWPYPDASKIIADTTGVNADGLSPVAAAAVSAVIAESRTSATSGALFSLRSVGGSEPLRVMRLREVAGAEGAVAGSTTAAARRAAREDAQKRAAAKPSAEKPAPAPGTPGTTTTTTTKRVGPGVTLTTAVTVTSVAAGAAGAAVAAGAAFGAGAEALRSGSSECPPASPANTPAESSLRASAPAPNAQESAPADPAPADRTPDAPAPASPAPPAPAAPVVRVRVCCPACGADNAPGNAECIACGKRLPKPAPHA